MKNVLAFWFMLVFSIPAAFGQSATDEPLKIGDITVSGSLRTRIESWDWFKGNANNVHTFPGAIFRAPTKKATPKHRSLPVGDLLTITHPLETLDGVASKLPHSVFSSNFAPLAPLHPKSPCAGLCANSAEFNRNVNREICL